MTRGRRLPLAFVLGVLLLILTLRVHAGRWPVAVDVSLARALPIGHASGLPGFLLSLSLLVADLATPTVTVLITAGAAVLMTRGQHALSLIRVGARLLLLTGSVLGGKALLSRPGPPGSARHGVLGYYPSGHTATALVCTVTLAALVAQRHPDRRRQLYAASATWTVLVGTCMVFHRFHWLSDVLAALLLGGLILIVVPLAAKPARRRPDPATST